MKLFNLTLALAFSLTLAAGMGSKSKPATPMEDPKVLLESTRASAPDHSSVELIENTAEDNQKVEKDLDKSTAHSDDSAGNKKTAKAKDAKKTKTPAAKKKPAAKSSAKSSKKVQIK